jgi:Intron-binding protein aquarius N-terminus
VEFLEPEAAEEEVPKKKKSKTVNGAAKSNTKETLRVSTCPTLNMGPYPQDIPKTNTIRFTPAQCKDATFFKHIYNTTQSILMHHI